VKDTYRWDFFIAHAAPDTATAERLYDLLEPCRVFLDSRCLLPGDDWDQELPHAQADSLITVILVSHHNDRAYYLREEIAIAIRKARNNKTKHRVVPVYLDSVNLEGILPYGLHLKQGLRASTENELATVASTLKASLEKIASREGGRSSSGLIKLDRILAKAFAKMQVETLATDVVLPLLRAIHSGRVEQISSDDSNRHIAFLSFGMDSLRRPHILCVRLEQVHSLSELKAVAEVLKGWKANGVLSLTGRRYLPDELWLILSGSFSSSDHTRAATMLEEMNQFAIKVVPGDELGSLVAESIPDIATRIARFSRPEIVGVISTLDRHTEARAFGLATDRNITDFYVTAALAPHAIRASAALRNELKLGTYKTISEVPLGDLIRPIDALLSTRDLKKALVGRIWALLNDKIRNYKINGSVTLTDDIDEVRELFLTSFSLDEEDILEPSRIVETLITHKDTLSKYLWKRILSWERGELKLYNKGKRTDRHATEILARALNEVLEDHSIYSPIRFQGISLAPTTADLLAKRKPRTTQITNRLLLEHAFPSCIRNWNRVMGETVQVEVKRDCGPAFQKLIAETRAAVRQCPHSLRADLAPVKRTFDQLNRLEEFIRAIERVIESDAVSVRTSDDLISSDAVRVRVPEPERLLQLGNLVLVEGPPGCGKTTLLKILTLNILNRDGNAIYLPCSRIPPDCQAQPLGAIASKYGVGAIDGDGTFSEAVLIIDGLDEAPFDLTKAIQAVKAGPKHIVVSCRTAFATDVRAAAFRIALVPFEHSERDEFFERWFRGEPELLIQARNMVATHRDIDIQTRLPLIATITVALLQNGVTPRSRAEIYGLRLDLLLSKWDRTRGVKRVHIDNPDAKRRFLRFLAHELHAARPRKRIVKEDELRDIYQRSLGQWGYHVGLERVLEDLVIAGGVITEEGPGTYSLGHLTFQEHLAGEHIVREYSIKDIASLLGDDWWREPLNFYASLKGDITELLDYVMDGTGYIAHARQLALMSKYAPYTSAGAIEMLNELAATTRDEDVGD
jgi:energy-coupling factor transporter ATP-binding protein EcfA2